MCIDFDGHHSGGSSFDSVIRCGPYPQVPVGLLKKKKIINQVKSPSPESRTPNSVRISQSGRTGNRGVTKSIAMDCIQEVYNGRPKNLYKKRAKTKTYQPT